MAAGLASNPALTACGVAVHAYARSAQRAARPGGGRRRACGETRLRRLEEAVDAAAVEVERVGEGQCFLPRLNAERGAERTEPPAASVPAATSGPAGMR